MHDFNRIMLLGLESMIEISFKIPLLNNYEHKLYFN